MTREGALAIGWLMFIYSQVFLVERIDAFAAVQLGVWHIRRIGQPVTLFLGKRDTQLGLAGRPFRRDYSDHPDTAIICLCQQSYDNDDQHISWSINGDQNRKIQTKTKCQCRRTDSVMYSSLIDRFMPSMKKRNDSLPSLGAGFRSLLSQRISTLVIPLKRKRESP